MHAAVAVGYVPDDIAGAPRPAVERIAERLEVPPDAVAEYGGRMQTRTDHLREVAGYLGWHAGGEMEFKELDQFLLARAMEHDSPGLLFRLACEHLRSACVIRPGPVWLSERVAAARSAAKTETFHQAVDAVLEQQPRRASTHPGARVGTRQPSGDRHRVGLHTAALAFDRGDPSIA